MYSAVFFGCPATTITPRRFTSTPTESMLVASTTSIGAEELRAHDGSSQRAASS
jgi:hypothetical protein